MVNAGPWRRKNIKSYIKRCAAQQFEAPMQDKVLKQILGEQGFDVNSYYFPRNVADRTKLYETLKRFGTHTDFVRDEHIEAGIDLAYRIFAKRGKHLSIATIDDVKTHVKWTKSSGLPLLVSKQESFQYSLDRINQVLRGEKAPNPCIAYMRTGFEKKTRLIWGYPLEMILLEAKYAIPLIEHFKYDRDSVIPYGWRKPELGVKITYDIGKNCLALDYSKFDSTISAGLIRVAFDILFTWFEFDEKERQLIESYFIHCPIVMPDGNLYTGKKKGVPSGSYFTQLIDSVVNVILIGAMNHKFKLGVKANKLLVLGDDSIFKVSRKVELTALAVFLSNYGIILNEQKSLIEVSHFLGANWEKGLPDERVEELLRKALNPERIRMYGHNGWAATRREAMAVLYNYASCYLSAATLIPKEGYHPYRLMSAGMEQPVSDPEKWMTGSDAFLASFKVLDTKEFVTITSRMLA